jgi:MtaA/CmuA family methyltransferase
MSYSALQRFHDAITSAPQDRYPILPLIGGWAATHFSHLRPYEVTLDRATMVKTHIRAAEKMGYDAYYAYIDPLFIPEAFGCEIRFRETGLLVAPLKHNFRTLEDVHNFPLPVLNQGKRLAIVLETVKHLKKYSQGDRPVAALFEGPFTTMSRIFEAELIMRMIYKQTSILQSLIKKITRFLIEFASAVVDNGGDILIIPEPMASSSMISPKTFQDLVLPCLQDLIDTIPIPTLLHVCGDTSLLLESMDRTQAEVLSLDQCMDLTRARQTVPHAALGGNVNPVESLLMGDKETVIQDTLQCLRTGGQGPFVLMSGCGIPANSPMENIEAMITTAKEYGLGT